MEAENRCDKHQAEILASLTPQGENQEIQRTGTGPVPVFNNLSTETFLMHCAMFYIIEGWDMYSWVGPVQLGGTPTVGGKSKVRWEMYSWWDMYIWMGHLQLGWARTIGWGTYSWVGNL